MITLTASLVLALALPGAPAGETTSTPASSPSSPMMIAVSSTDSPTVLAGLTQFSGTMPVLASDAVAVEPMIIPVKPVKRVEAPIVFHTKTWLALTAVQHSTATFDAWSTRQSITSGRGHELNPLMKPFAGSGAIYGMIQVAPMATDFLGKRLMSSKHPTLRKLWWVPQAAGSVGFMFSGINNLRVASR